MSTILKLRNIIRYDIPFVGMLPVPAGLPLPWEPDKSLSGRE